MNNKKELTIEQEVTRDCPILFQMRHRPCNETCMCWGWEHNHGWDNITDSMSRQLEMLNIQYYSKYRVRIQIDQIKEKFGNYTVYFSVVTDPNAFVTWLSHKFEDVYDWLNNWKKFDYKLKKVVDVEPFDYDDKLELTKEEYDKKINNKYKCSNVEYKEENGKYFEICHLRNYGKYHFVPTKHKFLWKIKTFCFKAKNWLLYISPRKDNAEVRNCIEYMNRRANAIVREAEEECAKHCEDCGAQIGTDWSPTCQTTGYITYICDKCASKLGKTYIKNGELWQGDTLLKTKDQLTQEYKEYETT